MTDFFLASFYGDKVMTDRELLQQALEWVEWFASDDHSVRPTSKARETAEAIKARLAQPEQWTPVEIGVDVTQEGAHVVGMYVDMPEAVRHVFYSKFHPAPTKKEWVGLTNDEVAAIYKESTIFNTPMYFAQAIEAKLKEKNSG